MTQIPEHVVDAAADQVRRHFEYQVLYGHWERPVNYGLPSVNGLSGWLKMNTETFRANFMRFPWWR